MTSKYLLFHDPVEFPILNFCSSRLKTFLQTFVVYKDNISCKPKVIFIASKQKQLKFIFYKKGDKISWLQDFLQILSHLVPLFSRTKSARNLATTKF